MTTLRAGSATDTGLVRRNNQDQFLVSGTVFAVADGMGGHVGGEVASLTAVDALRAAFDQAEKPPTAAILVEAVRSANLAVFERSQVGEDLRGMGTTLTTAALIVEQGEERIAIANVGDSRAYVLAQGELTQLTDDHSVPEELVRQGQLGADEVATHPQRHILTRALGILPDVEVDIWQMLPYRGDRIMLCSDGLCREVTDGEIASVLRRLDDPDEAAHELVDRARASGGADNITVVVIEVVGDDGRAEAASAALAAEGGASTAVLPPRTMASAPAPTLADDPGPSAKPSTSVADAAPPLVHPPATPAPPPPRTGTPTRDLATRAQPLQAGPEAPPGRGGDDGRHRGVASVSPKRKRRVTFRVIFFLFLVVAVFGAAVGAVVYFARDTFFVGLPAGVDTGTDLAKPLQPATIIIYRGRPGGILWFKPTVERRSKVTTDQVPVSRLPDLRQGKIEPSLTAAQAYVDRLVASAATTQAAAPATGASTSTTSTTAPTG